MRILDKVFIDSTAVAAPVNTDAIDMEQQIGLSVQMTWTSSTATAVATLQTSNDGVNWVDTASTVSVSNDSGSEMLYATDFHFKYARVNVNVTAGSINT